MKYDLLYTHTFSTEAPCKQRTGRGGQRQNSLVFFSLGQNQWQFYCSSVVPDLWDMATIWMMGWGEESMKRLLFWPK